MTNRLMFDGSSGTSPRAWGEDRKQGRQEAHKRNIPTGVGRRPRRGQRVAVGPEHPHGRGEKSAEDEEEGQRRGTSPRAWGEAHAAAAAVRAYRNIPTGVGRRRAWRRSATAGSEHPHGRGEKGAGEPLSLMICGTSPRAWGEGLRSVNLDESERNIPTGVGRRSRTACRPSPLAEHPHGRGEKATIAARTQIAHGTSPRAWGEDDGEDGAKQPRRNIPTGVGRSGTVPARPSVNAEHPHGRGEKGLLVREFRLRRGTSPRAWGEGDVSRVRRVYARNIPTGVGRR